MNRVVVTGIGAVCPIGNSLKESWAAAKNGLSGIARTTRFDVSRLKWKVTGELKRFDAGKYLTRKEIIRLDPFVHYAVAAACMAAEDAGLIEESSNNNSQELSTDSSLAEGGTRHTSRFTLRPSSDSAGVIIGSSRGGISTIEKELQKICSSHITTHALRTSAYLMPATTISMAASYVARNLGIKGHCLGISNACASGMSAIGEAFRLIKSGHETLVLCGGTEAPICRICVEGYGASGALSQTDDCSASRPFDRTRDGFVLSEGACILVLEDYGSALRREARIYGEVIGYGNTTDAFHQTIPSPEGEARAIKKALDEAEVKPYDIRFISAHGTSTPLGDKAETGAIKLSFNEYALHIPVTAVKSLTGHMLAASGALEAAFTLLAMNEGTIPPTINLRERDPECDLDIVDGPRKAGIGFALSQSFGFGGVNAVLIFKKTAV
jgi:3-oxoacyl-[acyl-carrier-protein] synthase II